MATLLRAYYDSGASTYRCDHHDGDPSRGHSIKATDSARMVALMLVLFGFADAGKAPAELAEGLELELTKAKRTGMVPDFATVESIAERLHRQPQPEPKGDEYPTDPGRVSGSFTAPPPEPAAIGSLSGDGAPEPVIGEQDADEAP